MRLLIQRVAKASVEVENQTAGEIANGLLIFVGIEEADTEEDINWLVNKVLKLRIFNDSEGLMNASLLDIDGEALIISQFTLHAAVKKGNRPSYVRAAKPAIALPLYNQFIETFENEFGKKVATGVFGADMKVRLLNDGPVTIWIDSKNRE